MADQAAFLGVFGLDRMILQLAQLADVVQDRGRDDQAPIERRIELVVILGIVVGQEAGDPGHAPDMLEQPGRVRMVEILGGRHPREKRLVLVEDVLDQRLEGGMVDVAIDQDAQLLLELVGRKLAVGTRSKKSKPSPASSSVARPNPQDLDLHAVAEVELAANLQAIGAPLGPRLRFAEERVVMPEGRFARRLACRGRRT